MTYDPSVPVAAQSPSLFPAQGVSNFTRNQTLINADHKFNLSAAADDGYHKVVHFVNQVGSYGDNTPAPISGVGQLYTKNILGSQHLFYHQGTAGAAANEAQLSIVPIRASVLFNSTGTILNAGGAAFNVASVTVQGTGIYRINFTVPMPSIYYYPMAMGMDNSSNPVIANPRGSASHGTYNLTTSFDVEFLNQNGSGISGLVYGTVIIFGG